MPAAKRPERPLVESVKTFAASQSTPVKFERITSAERQQIAAKSTDVRNFRAQRNQWEAPATKSATAASPFTQRPPSAEARPSTETRTAPLTYQRQKEQPPTETKSAAITAPKWSVAQPATRPATETKQSKSEPTLEVRVTRPEQVVVPNTAISPKPSESRYIEKQTPSHPAQEHFSADMTLEGEIPGPGFAAQRPTG